MSNQKEQQILQQIEGSSSVLICLPENPSTDAIASGLALAAVVEKKNKRCKVVSHGFEMPSNHGFLPKSNEIYDDLSALKKFIITVDLTKTSVEELSYNIEDEALKIYLSPKDGYFTDEDVSTESGDYSFDLIIVIDSPSLDALGRVYEFNADFFYHTPIINIDHDIENDHFGQIDLVQITATSTSEIVFELIKDWGEEILDEYIATNLLSGMISKTKSFQSGSVTPRSLSIASHLISQGARREDIVKHLYQSKKISTLKLWGRVLSKLEVDKEQKIVWSVLTSEDFDSKDVTDEDVPDIIDELIINTPDARNVFILSDKGAGGTDEVHAWVSVAPYINARELFASFKAEGTEHFVSFSSKMPAADIKSEILKRLREQTNKSE
ncbi:MAG: hypothetical protein COW24_00430 [Candidatus Kerfeldbacteria bacterium CG15_BIG_FIL_POST_REV_8_21_14_020_45_12]|uniref:DDH domain-containing protein n=1 Tax=Candidatus Kerfeldbacteria bacterium CG15_BIG_FIL_POST_REV_8_21_14_020_45_12 TaxID=2014247 RepID=A0A2M7H581_9BACT|nr:MAG: hypothetical protein COW24_00430 [Candidatus Kerfeldbacteria bacterium CG15_BIG_FIL_POST_REV_8_21_14_020_45_12]PJA92790.1 MAG: hypothetical protein CO132_05970 [Candidatus Kerfeldbacteria bacterium CG_4_9_14_3_um_filter_45_8]